MGRLAVGEASQAAIDPASLRRIRAVKAVLVDLLGPPAQQAYEIRFWDGSSEGPPAAGPAPRFVLVLKRPGALRRMLLPPSELAFGEAYLRDDFDVLGDLEAAASLAEAAIDRLRSPASLARLLLRLRTLPRDDRPSLNDSGARAVRLSGRRHSRIRDGTAVRFHYNLGNDFYALWLDQRMLYSCAYFETGTESLDAAQTAKLDYICRKLRLRSGERLLDIGCGWGGLIQYAAERYGVQATGITLSEHQAELVQERVAAAGLTARCRVEVRDYRELPRNTRFDKVASVGMIEHVGRSRLPTYFAEVHRLLEPGGLFLNHGIVELPWSEPRGPLGLAARLIWRRGGFIHRHVFPDGELVTLGEMIRAGELAGFETRDLECLREHYVLTLRYWMRRLETQHEAITRLVGEPTYRIWRLFVAGSARGFATGSLSVVQTILSKLTREGVCRLPLTRADLYRESRPPGSTNGAVQSGAGAI